MDETQPKDAPTLCSEALRIGLGLLESVACRKFSTHAAAARAQGLSTEKGHQHRILTRLDADLQEQVLAGHVDGHTVNRRVVMPTSCRSSSGSRWRSCVAWG